MSSLFSGFCNHSSKASTTMSLSDQSFPESLKGAIARIRKSMSWGTCALNWTVLTLAIAEDIGGTVQFWHTVNCVFIILLFCFSAILFLCNDESTKKTPRTTAKAGLLCSMELTTWSLFLMMRLLSSARSWSPLEPSRCEISIRHWLSCPKVIGGKPNDCPNWRTGDSHTSPAYGCSAQWILSTGRCGGCPGLAFARESANLVSFWFSVG